MRTSGGRRAVVVGGGVGGLTAALALHQVGWRVDVLERRPADVPEGTGLTVWPNAIRALRVLGLAPSLLAHAQVVHGTRLLRPDGRALSRVPGDALARRQGEPLLGLVRGDLTELLEQALPDGVLHRQATVSGVDAGSADRPAVVHCAGEPLSADLVVAADGLCSVLRRQLWPQHPAPRYSGYTSWRAVVPAADGPGAFETWGRGQRFGAVPVGAHRTYLYATADAVGQALDPDLDPELDLERLRRRFADWHDPVPTLLSRVSARDLLRHDVYALRPSPRTLSVGRVALLGDAAHAMEPNLGQGACLAIEDAVVLAHAVRSTGDVTQQLAGYSRTRSGRVRRLARQSHVVGWIGQLRSRPLIAVRDTAMRLTPSALTVRGTDAAAGWRPPPGQLRVNTSTQERR